MSLVAVAPVLAQCTNRCTRRKGAVNAQPTNTEKPKMKKTRHHEEVVKCQNESTRVARLQSEPQGRERRRVGQNWLRMKTKAILTCESNKNLTLFFSIGFSDVALLTLTRRRSAQLQSIRRIHWKTKKTDARKLSIGGVGLEKILNFLSNRPSLASWPKFRPTHWN